MFFLWAVIRVRCACVGVFLMMGWLVDTVFEDLSRSFLTSCLDVLYVKLLLVEESLLEVSF